MQMRVLQPAEQASQESLRSLGQSSSGRLQTSSSNVSQLTAYTDLTSPGSLVPEPRYERPDIERIRTPEDSRHDSYAFASPMSVTSPASTNGTKRTASGHVKNAPSLPSTPLTTAFAGKRSRADSLSSTGSRAGELAWTLKARLGYAMAKVQHGWEHKNIREVEALAAHSHRHSMSQLDYSSRRPLSSSGGLSNGAGRLSMYEPDHPSKRLSASIDLAAPPRLQPAPDIRPASQRQHHHPPPAGQWNQPTAMSPPHTPLTTPRRPPTLRTELQTAEAEREALQALFQLGSPHSSQVAVQVPWQQQGSQASSSQASPLRAEFGAAFAAAPRKVTFARGESESDSGVESGGGEGVAVLEEGVVA